MPWLISNLGATTIFFVAVMPMITANSPWWTVAGTGKSGFGGNTYQSKMHSFAVETKLNSPWGLAFDSSTQRLYIADTLNNAIRSVHLSTGLLETIAGTGEAGFAGDGSIAASAKMNMPTGLALDQSRQLLYISDMKNHRVRAMSLVVGHVYQAEDNVSVAPTPAPTVLSGPIRKQTCPNTGTPLNVSALYMGSKFCHGSTGGGFVMYLHSTLDYIDFNVQAGSGAGSYELRFRYADRHESHERGARLLRLYVNGAVRTHALEFRPTGKLPDGRRVVFGWSVYTTALTAGSNVIRLEVTGQGGPEIDHLYVVPPRPTITTVAGTGTPGVSNDITSSINALSANLHTPYGLALDTTSRILYIADAGNGRVRRLDIQANTISTIAGGATTHSSQDGIIAATSKLFMPVGLVLDSTRTKLFVTDSVEGRARRIDLTTTPVTGGRIDTVAGFGIRQAPFELKLSSPQGLVLDGNNLIIADQDNARIRVSDLTKGLCPNLHVSQLHCGFDGVTSAVCASLGCCFDTIRSDCQSQWAPDGRVISGFQPESVLTRIDGKERTPPVSFILGVSTMCCYPKLQETKTMELLDDPAGLAWDSTTRELYVSQPSRNRVVVLKESRGRCLAASSQCGF